MNYIILPIFLAVIYSIGAQSVDYSNDGEFKQWVSQYYNGDDLGRIYPTWRRNADFVKYHNSLGLSYTVAMNKFTHLSTEDLPKSPLLVPSKWSSYIDPSKVISNRADIPDSVDWRKKGAVPVVYNQGANDRVAAIVITQSIESLWAVKTGKFKNASIKEFIDCCDCSQWNVSAYDCVAKLGGLAGEDYKSENNTCASDKYKVELPVSGGRWVEPVGDEQALAEAVAKNPIAIGINASRTSFQTYQSGVYYDPLCSGERLDHAMLVVGYGSMNGEDYWICQNSWGEEWGMNGYILVARNRSNTCGIASAAMYPYYTGN